MTDNEIIKALECYGDSYSTCAECPIKDDNGCNEQLANYALDIIKRQQAEIEQLKFEIAKLLPEGCPYATQVEVSNKLEARTKSEAIKEFAERLKEKSFKTIRNYGLTKDVVEVCDIDNLVKEMVGE